MKVKIIIVALCLLGAVVEAQTWQELGPFGKSNSTTDPNKYLGIGLISTVAVDPGNDNTIYLGAAGGMWVSYDQGNNWQGFINGKELPHGVSVGNIEIEKTDPNFMYISSGMNKVTRQKHSHSPDLTTSGIYRCQMLGGNKVITDISNGLPDPLGYYPNQYTKFSAVNGLNDLGYYIHVLKLNPFDPNILYAGTSVGLYYTTNAKSASPVWQKVTAVPSESVRSIAFTAGSTISNYKLYVTGDYFAMNTSDFMTWNNLIGTCSGCLDINSSYYLNNINASNKNSSTAISRSTFYASPSLKYPDRMYIGMTLVGNNLPVLGNPGDTWEPSNFINRYFLKHDPTGWLQLRGLRSSTYDPVLSAIYKPSISEFELVGIGHEYLEICKENTTGGFVRTTNLLGYHTGGHGTSDPPNPYSHGDIQDIKTSRDSLYFYIANDGLVSKFNPFSPTLYDISCWLPINNNGLSAAVGFHMDVHPATSETIAFAAMHNHVSVKTSGNNWKTSLSVGDGLEVAFSPGNELLFMTQNSGANLTKVDLTSYNETLLSGYDAGAWWFKNILRDPKEPNMFYNMGGGMKRTLRTVIDNTVSYSAPIEIMPLDGPSAVAISPSNNNYIYLAFTSSVWWPANTKLWVCNNALQASPTLTSITEPAAFANTTTWLKAMAVSDLNPQTLFVGYYNKINDGRARIYKTTDGGGSWVDYNNSATSIPGRYRIHCLLYEKGSNDGVYAGTDNGVYYTNRNMAAWIRYDVGLANVPVVDMHYHARDNKILVMTWGRGIWKVDPYCIAAGNLTINNANGTTYSNKPAQANGMITFSANTIAYGSTPRFELRATQKIDLTPGTYFIPSGFSSTLDAYITPCSGSSSLRMNPNEIESLSSLIQSPPVQEVKEEVKSIQLYPNPVPTSGQAKLFVGDYIDSKMEIMLFDLTGNTVFEEEIIADRVEVDVNFGPLQPGIYLLNVMIGGKVKYNTKIVVAGTTQGPQVEKRLRRKKKED